MALIALEVLYAFHWRVNSDEPQHLHVVWAWTQGLLPYRDVFDNHMPLFQMLSAPLMWLVGERADIVAWMRLGELPFWALVLWCTWRIGRTLFSVRAGLLAVAATALYPVFATRSIEYRPDLAWAALWLGTITIAVERPASDSGVSLRRAFCIGLTAGCAISISMKSILLIGFFLFALLLVAILRAFDGERIPLRSVAGMLLAGIAGFLLVPLALAAFFATHGAWQDMLYDVFRHNMVPGLGGRWEHAPAYMRIGHVWILPALLPLLCWLGLRLLRSSPQDALGARRAVVLLAALMYWIALIGYWPLLTQQDFLPFIPLLMVFVAGGLTGLATRGWPGWSRGMTLVLLCGEVALLLSPKYAPWSHRESAYTRTLGTVLALTMPVDTVMDCKGGSIFRTRATRLVLEGVTLHRIQLGWLRDDIPEHLRQTRVVIRDCGDAPPRTRAFLDQNYLPIGDRVEVAGTRLTAVPAATAVAFDLGVAAPYSAITDRGDFQGSIDGLVYEGPRMLAPGRHVLVSTRAEQYVVLLWSRALAQGFHAIVQSGRSAPDGTAKPKALR